MLPLILAALGYLAGKAIMNSIEDSHERRAIESQRRFEIGNTNSEFPELDEVGYEIVPGRRRR